MADLFNMEIPDFERLCSDLPDIDFLGNNFGTASDVYQIDDLGQASEDIDFILEDLENILLDNTAELPLNAGLPDSPFDQEDFTELLSEGVSSPGSITSGNSYSTDTYSPSASEADDAYIRIPVKVLLDLLAASSAPTSPLGTVEESTPCVPESISNTDSFEASESKSENVEKTTAADMTTNTGSVFSGEHGKVRSAVAKRKSAGAMGNGPLTKHRKTLPGADKKALNRIQNNAASKRARDTHKQKQQELFLKEEELERSNAAYKAQIMALTKEIEIEYARNTLVQRLGSSN